METVTVYGSKAAEAIAKINLKEEKNQKEMKFARYYGIFCIILGVLAAIGAVIFTHTLIFVLCCIVFLIFGGIEFYSSSNKKMTEDLIKEVNGLPLIGEMRTYTLTKDTVKSESDGLLMEYSWDLIAEWGYEGDYIYLKTKDNRLMLLDKKESETFVKEILYEKEIFPKVEKAEDINTLVTEEKEPEKEDTKGFSEEDAEDPDEEEDTKDLPEWYEENAEDDGKEDIILAAEEAEELEDSDLKELEEFTEYEVGDDYDD